MPELPGDGATALEAQMQHENRAKAPTQHPLVREIGRHARPDAADPTSPALHSCPAAVFSIAGVHVDADQLERHRAEVGEMQLVEQMRRTGSAHRNRRPGTATSI